MDADAVRGLARTARSFASRYVAPVVDADGRDGELSMVPAVLDSADELGVTGSPDPTAAGHEYGVWGSSCLDDGPPASLAMLEEIASVCAGVACCVHVVGLGSLELAGSDFNARRVAIAFDEDGRRFDRSTLETPWPGCTTIVTGGDDAALSGTKDFVWTPSGCDGFVVYAAGDGGWERVFVSTGDQGVTVEDLGLRTGLSAVGAKRLDLKNVPISARHRLQPRGPAAMLRRHWLGLAAIAVGNARGALEAARWYTAERYQGGGQIETHPAVGILLGEAVSRLEACAAHVRGSGDMDTDDDGAVLRAAAVKLRATVDCCQAVTDCLQVLGGYGYMEEFRLEKRLRDALALKSAAPRPDDARLLLSSLPGGGL